MSYEIILPLVLVLGPIGLFFILIVAACLWEKRPIQPYYIPKEGEEYVPSDLAAEANNTALRNGFIDAGLFHSGKEKMYRVRCDFWLSADYSTIAVVGSGTVAKIPTNGIMFYSWTKEGRILCTTNEIGEQDISGVEEQITWPQMKFGELAQKHATRLAQTAVTPFSADKPLANFFEIRRVKANAMVDRNFGYFVDDDEMVWKHTLKGALAFYFITVWIRPLRRFMRSLGLVQD